LTKLFLTIALKAANKFGILSKSSHLDSTSIHVHGQYIETDNSNKEESKESKPIKITKGYSKDHRPDLKQFLINMFATADGDVPLYFQVDDGNASDKERFPKLIKLFKKQWVVDDKHLYVADAALYSKENLKTLGKLLWLTRVPLSLKEAKELVEKNHNDFKASEIKGYKLLEHESIYGGIKQRWILLQNDKRRQSEQLKLETYTKTNQDIQQKALKRLMKKRFERAKDAKKMAKQFSNKMKYHQLEKLEIVKQVHYETVGRPAKNASPNKVSYVIKAELIEDLNAIERSKQKAGRFVLASNDISNYSVPRRFSNDELLNEYKQQQSSERGFRFLKYPLFFASSIFVKTAIATLAMIMALCLLVYTIGQRMLRQNLEEAEESLPNQLGKPTQRPTLRWIFQGFQAVHLIWINGVQVISNLTLARKKVLKYFSLACQKYYFIDNRAECLPI